MLRINRGGNRICSRVSEALGHEVVADLHDNGYYLTGFVRNDEQVKLLQEFSDSKVFPLPVSEGYLSSREVGANGIFAVYRKFAVNLTPLENGESEVLNDITDGQRVA